MTGYSAQSSLFLDYDWVQMHSQASLWIMTGYKCTVKPLFGCLFVHMHSQIAAVSKGLITDAKCPVKD